MKRDLDLIRKILLKVELCEDPEGPGRILEIDGYDNQLVSYHVKMLSEAGLLDAIDVSSQGPDGFCWWPGALTWQQMGSALDMGHHVSYG